eukprot:s634_g19.t1
MWNDILLVEWGLWVVKAVGECWKATLNRPKADAWAIRKMSNHVRRLRSRSDNQRHEEDAFEEASPPPPPRVAGPAIPPAGPVPPPNDDDGDDAPANGHEPAGEEPMPANDAAHDGYEPAGEGPMPADDVAHDGYEPAGEEPMPALIPSSPTSPKHAAPSPPPSPKFRFADGQRPSCPQATWDPETAESQRMPGLTPENEAWLEYQKSLKMAGGTNGETSVPSTAVDSPPANLDLVCVSDDEPVAPRDLSFDLDQAAKKVDPMLAKQENFALLKAKLKAKVLVAEGSVDAAIAVQIDPLDAMPGDEGGITRKDQRDLRASKGRGKGKGRGRGRGKKQPVEDTLPSPPDDGALPSDPNSIKPDGDVTEADPKEPAPSSEQPDKQEPIRKRKPRAKSAAAPSSGSAPEVEVPKPKAKSKGKAKAKAKVKAEAKASAGAGGKRKSTGGDDSQQDSQPKRKRKQRKPACDAPLPIAVENRDEFKKFPVGL